MLINIIARNLSNSNRKLPGAPVIFNFFKIPRVVTNDEIFS